MKTSEIHALGDEAGQLAEDLCCAVERLALLDIALPSDLAARAGIALRRTVADLERLNDEAGRLVPGAAPTAGHARPPAWSIRRRAGDAKQGDAAAATGE